MLRQLLSLFVIVSAALFVVAWYLIPTDVLRLHLYLAGESEAAIKNGSGVIALAALEVVNFAAYFIAAIVLSTLTNRAATKWRQPKSSPQANPDKHFDKDLGKNIPTVKMADQFGVSAVMFEENLDLSMEFQLLDQPTAQFLELLPPIYHGKISPLESHMLAAIWASDRPCDTTGAHGNVSLIDHTVEIWARAVDQFGHSSLHAIAAIMHDSGKVMSFYEDNGKWKRKTRNHVSLTNEFVRRLPAYFDLDIDKRMVLHDIAEAFARPHATHFHADILEAVRWVHIADMQTTAAEKMSKESQAATIDYTQLSDAILAVINHPELPIRHNCNARFGAHIASSMLYLPHDNAIVLKLHNLRAAIKDQLSNELADAIQLHAKPERSKPHPSDEHIIKSLSASQLLLYILQSNQTETGAWAIDVGRVEWRPCVALDAQRMANFETVSQVMPHASDIRAKGDAW
jgi:hypothetical protein